MAAVAVELLGVRAIEETERFTLLGGADARRGKLTIFDADGPRERGALQRIGLRVTSLEGREPIVDLGEGLEIELVETETDAELDLDHVTLRASDVEAAAASWEELGFARIGDARLEVGGAYLDLVPGDPGRPERPLLNHLGLRVDSADHHIREAEERGLEIADIVDAANTYAVFVWGPDGIKLEYVEHKPTFSLV